MDCECLLAGGKRVNAVQAEALVNLHPSHLMREKFGPTLNIWAQNIEPISAFD